LKSAGDGAAEVKRLFVRAPFRGSGVARLLMTEAVSRARTAGFAELVLDVMLSRVHVIDFYRRLGFTEVSADSELLALRLPLL
jgi:ribosomal protein S18 acetylase RimI-like enzyme